MAAKRKKGLSLEEKRQVMLGLFHETGEVFNLKELESRGTKLGVVTQTIKDVVQALVDDKLVEQDKVGSGNFFYSFPSAALMAVRARCDALEASIARDTAACAELEARLKALSADRTGAGAGAGAGGGDDRATKLAKLEELKARSVALDKSLALHADNDPAVLAALQAKVAGAKASADRWTDAIWALRSHLVKKFGREPKEVRCLLE